VTSKTVGTVLGRGVRTESGPNIRVPLRAASTAAAMATVRTIGARSDDLLRLLRDSPQARAHGVTPVGAVSAARTASSGPPPVSPVVLTQEW
jgi:hypothetical protein